jgi:Family of unknown function (DUF6232)
MSLVDVDVDGGTLWIGNSAYILKNITSIEPFRVAGERQPPRERANPKRRGVLIWIGLIVMFALGGIVLNPVVWLFVCAVSLGGPFILWRKGPLPPLEEWEYFEIKISTAGRERRVLTVQDWDIACDLTEQIANAITDPDAEFHIQVENLSVDTFHQGDNNVTYGDGSPIGAWHD